MSFHASNYGSLGGGIPTDLEGYAHTTIAGWMSARMDWGTGRASRSERLDACRELAARVREAVREADSALARWQEGGAR